MLRIYLFLLAFFSLYPRPANAGCDAVVHEVTKATGAKVFAVASTGDARLRAAAGDILIYCDRLGLTVHGTAKPATKEFYDLVGRAGAIVVNASAALLAKAAERCISSADTCLMVGDSFLDCWDGNVCRLEKVD